MPARKADAVLVTTGGRWLDVAQHRRTDDAEEEHAAEPEHRGKHVNVRFT